MTLISFQARIAGRLPGSWNIFQSSGSAGLSGSFQDILPRVGLYFAIFLTRGLLRLLFSRLSPGISLPMRPVRLLQKTVFFARCNLYEKFVVLANNILDSRSIIWHEVVQIE